MENNALMRQLVDELNQASDAYYNGRGELMTDYEWDAKFDQLRRLEEATGEVLPDSPTHKVSADTTAGQKEAHEYRHSPWPRPRNATTSPNGPRDVPSGCHGSLTD